MISVIIPVYNEEATILDCLRAFSNQTFNGKFEIIVIDNNSTDNSLKIIDSFIKTSNLDVKLVREKRQGIVFARQKGFIYAKYPIVASTDADSVVFPNWLKRISRNMKNKKVMACGGKNFYEKKRIPTFISYNFQKLHFRLGLSFLIGNNMAIRRDAFMEIDGFDLKYTRLEDFYISVQIKKYYHYYNDSPIVYDKKMNIDTSLRKYRHLVKFSKKLPNILRLYLRILFLYDFRFKKGET